jgi:hypothetical protein
MLTRLVPEIFYESMADGLELFVDCLGFTVGHNDGKLVVVEREGCKAVLIEDVVRAAKDRPEIALETDDINGFYAEIMERKPEMRHPNSSEVSVKPWGAKEFALLDKTKVCVIIRQW